MKKTRRKVEEHKHRNIAFYCECYRLFVITKLSIYRVLKTGQKSKDLNTVNAKYTKYNQIYTKYTKIYQQNIPK